MAKSGGHGGLIVVNAPRAYDRLPQQERLKKAIEFCGIKKGMKKAELMTAMKDCIPQYFKNLKEQQKAVSTEIVAIDNAEPKEQEGVRE